MPKTSTEKSRKLRKKLKEDSKLYEVYKTNVCPQRNVRNTFQLVISEQRKPTQEIFWD